MLPVGFSVAACSPVSLRAFFSVSFEIPLPWVRLLPGSVGGGKRPREGGVRGMGGRAGP